jgi:hypothetical protein
MPTDPRDYKLDIPGVGAPEPDSSAGSSRPFLSVQFECCNVYQRIYRDADGQHYTGRCPRCGKPIRFKVGEGGTNSRSFIVR